MREQNYPEIFAHYQKEFLKLDQESTAKRLALSFNDNYIEVPWFNETVRIERKTGDITTEDGLDIKVKDKLLILHHLYFSDPEAVHTGKWSTIRELKEASLLEQSCQKLGAKPIEESFAGEIEAFRLSCEVLGGKKMEKGDAAYVIQVLPSISLYYIFYDKDEEFPPACTILFESTIESFIHPEDVPMLAGVTTDRLLKNQEQAKKAVEDPEEEDKKVKITLLYVSETENTATAARYIEEGMLKASPHLEVRPMDISDRKTYDLRFLQESDAVVFGTPVYFGNMQWKMKQWFDTSIRINLSGKLGGAFATEQALSGGAEMAMLTMMQHMLVKNMLVYAPKSTHFGPTAIGREMESHKSKFVTFGEEFAQKAAELFGKK
ncbi:MAG: DUF3786 domain-containing protein [Eubacterium sp.]